MIQKNRDIKQFKVRLETELLKQLQSAAVENERSVTGEIAARLKESLVSQEGRFEKPIILL